MIYIDHKELTTQKRRQAAAAFRKAGKILEELKADKMLTLTLHQIIVEADKQIDATGPIAESLGFWVERMCKICVEPTVRRRVSARPEKTIFRAMLVRHLISCYKSDIPDISKFIPAPKRVIPKIEDEGTNTCCALEKYIFFQPRRNII